MFYPVKTPWLIKKWYPSCVWEMPADDGRIYLSFDDGPHPEITPFVLDTLKQFNARATFFCIGKNVRAHTKIYERILSEGHAVGNHTMKHLNGWKTKNSDYLDDIAEAAGLIDSQLFRPPYGRITSFQLHCLKKSANPFHVIMWSVLSGDFDPSLNREQCLKNVLKYLHAGNIIVFHDSVKAEEKLRYALPVVLRNIREKNLKAEKIIL